MKTGTIRQSRLIFKLYLIILGTVTVSCILFGAVSLGQTRAEQQRLIDMEKLDSLKQTERAFRMIFDITVGDLRTMSEEPEISRLAADTAGTVREAEAAIGKLQKMAEGSAIDAVWVWTPATGKVCSSYGSYVDISYSRNQKLLETFGENYAEELEENRDWVVFVYYGRIILAIRVSPDSECYAMADLDRNVLINYMYNGRWKELKEQSSNLAYIYDMDGNTINLINLPGFSADLLDEAGLYQTSSDNGRNARWYRVDSEACSWVYLMPKTKATVSILSGRVPLILGTLAVYLVLSSLVTWAILRQIYGPISNLLQALGHSGQQPGEGRLDEVEFIGRRYNEQVQLAEQRAGVIEEVSTDILEQSFRKLARREIESEELLRTFDQVGMPGMGTADYAIMVSRIRPQKNERQELELGLSQRSYRMILRQEDMDDIRLYSAFTTDHTCLTVVVFPESMSASSMRRAMDGLRNRLLQKCAGESYNVNIGYSRITNGWNYLHFVYSDCLQRLRQAERTGEDAGNTETGIREAVGYVLHLLRDRHYDLAEKDWQTITVHMSEATHEAALVELKEVAEELVERLIDREPGAAEVPADILNRLNNDTDLDGLDIEAAMIYIWECLSGNMGDHGAPRKKTDTYVDRAIAYIEENWSDPQLSVGDISAHIGISSQYLSSIFGTSTGKSLVTYINEYRVEKAIAMLTGTDMQVKDIGEQCGFNTMQSFFRVFKTITGKPPGQYRKDSAER